LQGFFSQHSEYSQLDFFVTGESYAGHYVPAISNRILTNNLNNVGPIIINLRGIAIGNGLVDPEVQYGYYAEMAWNNTVAKIVSAPVHLAMELATPECIALIAGCQALTVECSLAQELCDLALLEPVVATGIDVYDIREKCTYPPLCGNYENLNKFLSLASVKSQLGTTGHAYNGPCNDGVNILFADDWMKNFQTDIPALLANNLTVLVYAGIDDFICNWRGNNAWTLAMSWPGQQAFQDTPVEPFYVDGAVAGNFHTYQGFTFLTVDSAGHMVPEDQPVVASAMINAYISGQPFNTTSI